MWKNSNPPSLARKREPRKPCKDWIPAPGGMTTQGPKGLFQQPVNGSYKFQGSSEPRGFAADEDFLLSNKKGWELQKERRYPSNTNKVSSLQNFQSWKKISKTRKEGRMGKKAILASAMVGIPIFLVLAMGNAWAQVKVGDEAPSFVLPSSQDRLVDYYADYYGKHHLVLTFFPAAFTPV
jgi:hypothetical protein